MINLLPDVHKKEIRAARVNTILMRYITILSIGILVLGGLSVGTYAVVYNAHQVALEKMDESKSKENNFATIRQDADAFRSDLSTARTIIDKEINYSKLIYRIANATPDNVVLDSLKLSPETLGSEITLNASAKTNTDAVKLKDAYSKKTELFSDVKLDSVSGGSSDAESEYPVKVTLSLTILKEASK